VDDDEDGDRSIDPIEWTGGDEEFSVNRTPANAAYTRHEKGVIFSKGHISNKNWPKRLLLRHDKTSFKGACHFIYLIEAKVALYGPNLQPYKALPYLKLP
jgi:hypothetical protein